MITSSGLRLRRGTTDVPADDEGSSVSSEELAKSTSKPSLQETSRPDTVVLTVNFPRSAIVAASVFCVAILFISFALLLFVSGVLVGSWVTVGNVSGSKFPSVGPHLERIASLQGINLTDAAERRYIDENEFDENGYPRYLSQRPDDEEEEETRQIVSCDPDQELVRVQDNALDADTFEKMQNCLIGHPEIRTNHLNPEGFSGTRGFVIKFAREGGTQRFLNETKFSCGDFNPLVPFFEKARHSETNGFVMNVLVCDKPDDANKTVVGTHVDDTLGHMVPNTDFLAHTVSVLYLSVPEDMEGGQLELLGTEKELDSYGGDEPPVKESIFPVENSYAEFRGDTYHRVRGYGTSTKKLRVSLVLEQYKIAEEHEPYLFEYEQSEKDGMTMI